MESFRTYVPRHAATGTGCMVRGDSETLPLMLFLFSTYVKSIGRKI